MTIKTPQEIAAAQMGAFTFADGDVHECSAEFIAEQIAEAVEADRAQRREIDQDWRDDQENVRDTDHVSVSWTAHDSRGRNTFQSDMVITAKQAVGMFQGIGEA